MIAASRHAEHAALSRLLLEHAPPGVSTGPPVVDEASKASVRFSRFLPKSEIARNLLHTEAGILPHPGPSRLSTTAGYLEVQSEMNRLIQTVPFSTITRLCNIWRGTQAPVFVPCIARTSSSSSGSPSRRRGWWTRACRRGSRTRRGGWASGRRRRATRGREPPPRRAGVTLSNTCNPAMRH